MQRPQLPCRDHPGHPRTECPACDLVVLREVAMDMRTTLDALDLPGLPLVSGQHVHDGRTDDRSKGSQWS